MRTIKFRGKRVDNGEWIVGNLFVPNGFVKGIYICPKTTYVDFLPDCEEVTDMEEAMKDGCALGHFIEVDPETVGQFIDQYDALRNDLYEGDVIAYYNAIRYIAFHKGSFRQLDFETGFHPDGFPMDATENRHRLMTYVIGNIHDK